MGCGVHEACGRRGGTSQARQHEPRNRRRNKPGFLAARALAASRPTPLVPPVSRTFMPTRSTPRPSGQSTVGPLASGSAAAAACSASASPAASCLPAACTAEAAMEGWGILGAG